MHKHHELAFLSVSKSQTYNSPCLEDKEHPPQMMKTPPYIFHHHLLPWIMVGLKHGLKNMKIGSKPSWLRSLGRKSFFLRCYACHGWGLKLLALLSNISKLKNWRIPWTFGQGVSRFCSSSAMTSSNQVSKVWRRKSLGKDGRMWLA